MNSNFNSKFVTVGVTDSNFISGVVAHSLCKLHNSFLNAKFLHDPPINFSWYLAFQQKQSMISFS